MKSILAGLFMILVLWNSVGAPQQADQPAPSRSSIDAQAVWAPRTESLKKIRSACGANQGQALRDCFLTGMKEEGASPQAQAFARRLGGLAYMEGFFEAGVIDIAYTVYPFRANENHGWFLVNGSPDLIDVDDPAHPSRAGLEKDTLYRTLSKTYPGITLWPDDRSPNSVPTMKELRDRAQRFVISYRLTDGCRGCAYLGTAWIAFDFAQNGLFLGTRFLGVERTPRQAAPRIPTDTVEQGLTNPKRPVETRSGETFVILLGANHTTGYRWELVGSLNKDVLEPLGSAYESLSEGKPGEGGREVWSFAAKNAGTTKVVFQYVRPWEKQAGKAKTISFDIVVR